MQQQLLPTQRVSYFPMSEYEGEGRFRSIVSGEAFEVNVRRRVVDATYMRVTVPSMRPPPYEIAPGIPCVAPNELVRTRKQYDHYTIVGAGKTGMDACLWLLRQGVDPADLTWIMPRDSWLLDRARVQPGAQFAKAIAVGFVAQRQAIAEATSIVDLFDRLNAGGQLLRLTDDVRPTMYRCATVSLAELAQLRRIEDVVRLGHLRRVEESRMVLDAGTIRTRPGTLYVDCSANGLERRPAAPVFDGHRMTLQSVRTCQQVFSAALIAHVEAAYSDDAAKNDFCIPVPHPDSDLDWLRTTLASSRNQLRRTEDAGPRAWLEKSRLDFFGHLGSRLPSDAQTRARQLDILRADALAQRAKLESLLTIRTPDDVVA